MFDSLGDRMKKYEYVTRTHLIPRMPVIIRIDGKAFHTFTRGFQKPFDEILSQSMRATMKYLCENIQGCVLGYTQSDEITLVLVDYKKLESCSWFDYNIQKCVSIASSMATLAFNREFTHQVRKYKEEKIKDKSLSWNSYKDSYYETLYNAASKGAMFDARVFNIPKEEVCNNILWRQNDATRNSIEMAGHTYFSHSQLERKSCSDIQDMLMLEKGINWNNYPTVFKRGCCCVKRVMGEVETSRGKWVVDEEIPIFKGEGRRYVEDLVYVGDGDGDGDGRG